MRIGFLNKLLSQGARICGGAEEGKGANGGAEEGGVVAADAGAREARVTGRHHGAGGVHPAQLPSPPHALPRCGALLRLSPTLMPLFRNPILTRHPSFLTLTCHLLFIISLTAYFICPQSQGVCFSIHKLDLFCPFHRLSSIDSYSPT